jgi:hypothetical protein
MSDPWINRLVVAGPIGDVKAFAKSAIGFGPPDFWDSANKPAKLSLSFAALYDLLPAKAQRCVPKVDDEPADLVSERSVTGKNKNGEKIYRFQLSSYEPDLLLTEISKLFPGLSFILGWVAPNVDEACSKLIKDGKVRRFDLSVNRRETIRASKYKEWGEDCLDAD